MPLPRKTVLLVIERVLRRDALLQPYFEDGVIRVIDRPDEGYIDFKPGTPGKTREFVLERVRTLRGARPEEWDTEKVAKWTEREEMIREAQENETLAWYLREGYLKLENTAESCAVWVNDELPEEEKQTINKLLMEIWTGEEMDDEVAGEMAERLKEMSPRPLSRDPVLGGAIRDLMLETFREDELIGGYVEKGLIRLNSDPSLKVWELSDLLSLEDKKIIYDRGISIARKRFGLKGQQ